MKAILEFLTVLSVIYITQGNPLIELDERICNEKIKNLLSSEPQCQIEIDQSAKIEILQGILLFNLTASQFRAYSEQHCDKVNAATRCLIENKNLEHDQRCQKFTKYGRGIYRFDSILMKTLYLCGNNNGQHFYDILPNDGLRCMYDNKNYSMCFIRKQDALQSDPNSLASQACINTQTHLHCLDEITDCPNSKAVSAMKDVILLYKNQFNC